MRIKCIKITNFRSIRNVEIDNINNVMALVGKNNAGKSSIVNAIRTFWGEYELKFDDFHKDQSGIQITLTFTVDDDYYSNYIHDSKIGISKIPSNTMEFNVAKEGTAYESFSFNKYKEIIKSQDQSKLTDDRDILKIWKRGLEYRFGINSGELTIIAKASRDNLKVVYYRSDEEIIKDVERLFPLLAFIDDDRRFDDEENGRAKTLTGDLFGNHILKKERDTSETLCNTCNADSCTECLEHIYEKSIADLSLSDLEKLTKNKVQQEANTISNTLSEFFSKNYKEDYKIILDPRSNIDKSFNINTKIYDPNLGRRVDLSNVGAGLRNIYVLSLLQAYHKLCDNNHTIFLVEEPEIYLHPSLQKTMGNILYEISNSNQVIFTTHSPLVLKNLEASQVKKVLLNDKHETEVIATDLSDIINELGYSTEDILNTDFVIFVEGKEDKERLKAIIDKYYTISPQNIFIIDTKGCNNIETYATLRFLHKTTLRENFLIIKDSDTKDVIQTKKAFVNKLRENLGEQYFEETENHVLILAYSSLENYFLNPDILIALKLVRDYNDYEEKIISYLDKNKDRITSYLIEQNGRERAQKLESLIYRNCPLSDKIEDIKKYIRGHELFGVFTGLKNKINEYIEKSTKTDFAEILDALNMFPFFNERQRKIN